MGLELGIVWYVCTVCELELSGSKLFTMVAHEAALPCLC